jgi:hypothetical protein
MLPTSNSLICVDCDQVEVQDAPIKSWVFIFPHAMSINFDSN